MTIIAAADGSALGNPGPAGWAWYVDEDRWASGGWPRGTNNMGELTAVVDLLHQTAGTAEDLLVYCDSTYVINSITKWMPNWKRKNWRKGDGKPVQNVEIMKALDEAVRGRAVRFEWVKGHAGHELNEEADRLANGAATAYSVGRQPDSGPGFGGVRDLLDPHAGYSPTEQPAPEPDLFSVIADDPADHVAEDDIVATSDEDRVIALERELLAAVRTDPSGAARLLHPEWHEVDRSGRMRTREQVLAAVGEGVATSDSAGPEVVTVARIAEPVILLLSRESADDSSVCSSLWVRDGGDWRQRFRQVTAEG